MPEPANDPVSTTIQPDYEKLIRFLIQPFLESPEALKLDCEVSPNKPRVWIRLAFEGEDKGRVFGRGGRNIQAIRTVLTAIAKMAGHSIHLDVFGGTPNEDAEPRDSGGRRPREGSDRRSAPRSTAPKPAPRPRQPE